MFRSCRLTISQNPTPSNPNTLRWVEVFLHSPQVTPMPDSDDDAVMTPWAKALIEYPWHGRWRLGANSLTEAADSAYTVGSSIPPENKFWRWSLRDAGILEFVERTKQVGGGLEYGQQVEALDVALVLYHARIAGRGIEPYDATGIGTGSVTLGSNILRPGAVSWNWEVSS